MDKDIKLARQNEAYYRKQMEYYQEQIKILEEAQIVLSAESRDKMNK